MQSRRKFRLKGTAYVLNGTLGAVGIKLRLVALRHKNFVHIYLPFGTYRKHMGNYNTNTKAVSNKFGLSFNIFSYIMTTYCKYKVIL